MFLDYGYTITFLLTQVKLKKEIDLTKGGVSDASGNRLLFFFSFSAQAIIKLISFDMSLISTQSLIYLYLPNDSYSISCLFCQTPLSFAFMFLWRGRGPVSGWKSLGSLFEILTTALSWGHCYCKKIQSEYN